jgi:PAS domain S-box-containing protein
MVLLEALSFLLLLQQIYPKEVIPVPSKIPRIDELVDIPLLQKWLDNFHVLTGTSSALIDSDGTIHTRSGWQEICTRFHRNHPETLLRCVESDNYIKAHLDQEVVGYQCKNGLVDYAAPVFIEGEHVATLFAGQFFHASPDRRFFEDQARKYGFPEKEYLQALDKVPLIPEEKAKLHVTFIARTTEIIAELGNRGLRKIREEEEKTRRYKKAYHNLTENIPGMTYQARWISGKREVLFASDYGKALFGISLGNDDGTNSYLESFIFAEDLERISEELSAAVAQESSFVLDYRIRHCSGDVLWITDRGKAFFRDGVPQIEGIALDCTRQKQTEEELQKSEMRFHRAIRNSAIPSILFDSSMKIFEISRGVQEATGYSGEEITHLREWISRITPGGISVFEKLFSALKEDPLSVASEIMNVHSKDGEEHFWELHCVDLGDFAEESRLYKLIAQDVTQRENFQKTLLEIMGKLEDSNRDLQQFAYITSHDLQEPLRMISSYLQLLQKRYQGKLGSDADDFIHYAVDGANRMKRLIQDILSYSRINTHGKTFSSVPGDRILQRVLQSLDLKIREKNAHLTISPLPVFWGDPAQLEQLFQNLIDNALKFSSQENPRVDISAEPREDAWIIHVRDNGMGIKSDYFEKIFLMFQRLNHSEEYPGTGLGLALCKRIVERHGGRIWVSSEESKGATFSFTLRGAPENPSERGESP